MSRAYAKAGRIKEAYDALRQASRLEPAAAEHYIDLAMLCLEHENYDLGLEIVDVGLKHRPDSSMLYLQRGVVLAMTGAIEQAEKEFDRASRAAPDDPAPYVALAMTWMLKGETPRAVEVLRARTRTGTPRAVLFYALGMALLRSGAAPDDEAGTEAMEAFREATRLSPDFSQAQAELGKLLLKRNDVPGAIEHLEKALALEPDESAPGLRARAGLPAQRPDRSRAGTAGARQSAQRSGTRRRSGWQPGSQAHGRPDRARRARARKLCARSCAPPASAAIAARYDRATACASSGDVDGAIAELRRDRRWRRRRSPRRAISSA